MKKRSLLIVPLLFAGAIRCLAQADSNQNTTYGGVVRDANTLGKYVANPTPGGGAYNAAFGYNALGSGTPSCKYNSALGDQALFNVSSGSGSVAIGYQSSYNITTGFQNTATGYASLFSNVSGSNNCAYGYNALSSNTNSNNCGMGVGALLDNVTGANNVALGHQSQHGAATYSASDNTAVGYWSFYSPGSNSQFNVAVGEKALYDFSAVQLMRVTAVGYQTLYNDKANNLTATGYEALYSNTTGISNTANGYLALEGNLIGSGNTADGNVALANNLNSWNTAVGDSALYTNTSGWGNTGIGFKTIGKNSTGWGNTGVGYEALQTTNAATYNTGLGFSALTSTTTGNNNVAVGWALPANTQGSFNVAVGNGALFTSTIASYNVAVGMNALNGTQTGASNTAVGTSANPVDVAGSSNTANGFDALFNNFSSWNTAIGDSALYANTHGTYNTSTGGKSLITNTTGTYNTALGYGADVGLGNQTDATAIGYNAIVTGTDKMVLGNNNVFVGIGLSNAGTPAQNKLEISAFNSSTTGQPCNPAPAATFTTACTPSTQASGSSGLRFRDLTHGSIPWNYQPNSAFLTVDDLGNVVYMNLPTSPIGIGTCLTSATTFASGDNGWVNLGTNANNFYFDGQNSNLATTNVAIGNGCAYTPKAKLDVYQNSGSQTGSIGVYVKNQDNGTCSNMAVGIESQLPLNNNPSVKNAAEILDAESQGTGAYSYTLFAPQAAPGFNQGTASLGLDCNTGLIGTLGDDVLQIAGDGWATGNWLHSSDRRFKTNLTPLKSALDKVEKINSYYYYFDTIQFPGMHFSSKKQVGFVAQNVDSVLPELVKMGANGYYGMDYAGMSVLLLQGEKELKAKTDSLSTLKVAVDSMRNALNAMQTCVNKLCAATMNQTGTESTENVQNVNLSSASILYQNAPNPFGQGGTKINYFLPEGTQGASIVFYDSYGSKIKDVQLTQTGNGTINVNPAQLTTGMYTYSLVINGIVVDTKKMVFAK